MVLIAIIRTSHYRIHGTSVDITWLMFWVYIEACIATIMGSLTAFRTLFLRKGDNASAKIEKNPAQWPYYFQRRVRLAKQSTDLENIDHEQLPRIPSPMLTDMRAYIHHFRRSPGDEEGQDAHEMADINNHDEIHEHPGLS